MGLMDLVGFVGLMGLMGLVGFVGFVGFLALMDLMGFLGFLSFRGFLGFLGLRGFVNSVLMLVEVGLGAESLATYAANELLLGILLGFGPLGRLESCDRGSVAG